MPDAAAGSPRGANGAEDATAAGTHRQRAPVCWRMRWRWPLQRAAGGWLLGLALAATVTAPAAWAQELIANAAVRADHITLSEARLFFTMRLQQWPNAGPVRVFVLPDENPLHADFVKRILGLFPYQLRRVWDRQVYSGTGQAPITVASEQEMIDRVAATPGALGYAASRPEHPRITVLEVR